MLGLPTAEVPGSPVVVEVSDPALRAQVHQLAAGAGIEVVGLEAAASLPPGVRASLALLDGKGAALTGHGVRLPVILVADHHEAQVWTAATRLGAETVVLLPEGADWLRQRLSKAPVSADPPGRLITVVGARGGSGATTLAVGLARAALAHGLTVLADGDSSGPGIDLSLGLESAAGLRWGDVDRVRGPLPATAMAGRLLSVNGLDVLAFRPPADLSLSWQPVVSSLRRSHEFVVGDVPRYTLTARGGAASSGPTVIVTGLDLVGVTQTRQLITAGLAGSSPLVALRRGRGPMSLKSAIAALADATVVELPTSRRIAGAADFGDLAQAVSAGAYGRACRLIVDRLAA